MSVPVLASVAKLFSFMSRWQLMLVHAVILGCFSDENECSLIVFSNITGESFYTWLEGKSFQMD